MEDYQLNQKRLDVHIDRLRAGAEIRFGTLGFYLSPQGLLEIRKNSSWRIENITAQTASADFREAMQEADDLLSRFSALSEIAASSTCQYVLVHDYGSGVVEICRLMADQIHWAKGFRLR
jgi:hypothetical protein